MTICIWVNARDWSDIKNGDYIVGDFNNLSNEVRFGKKLLASPGPTGSGIRFGSEFASFSIASEGKWVSVRTTPSTPYKIGLWYHLTGIYDGDNLKIYVNGQLEGQEPHKGTINFKFVESQLGGIFGQRRPGFDGTLDEVAIYRRALTDDEIDTIYRMGVLGKHFVK